MTKYCKDADIIGWVGNVGFVVGAVAIAVRSPIEGQALNVLGNAFYIYVAIRTKLPSLLTLSFLLGAINFVGLINWLGG